MKKIYNRHSIADEVYFTSITDKKFKINSIAVYFISEMSHNAAENAVLTRMLTKCCEKYDTMAKLNRRLSELYSAGLNWSVSVQDDCQLCGIYATMLDNRFALDGEDIMRETAEILAECIFDPHFVCQLTTKTSSVAVVLTIRRSSSSIIRRRWSLTSSSRSASSLRFFRFCRDKWLPCLRQNGTALLYRLYVTEISKVRTPA